MPHQFRYNKTALCQLVRRMRAKRGSRTNGNPHRLNNEASYRGGPKAKLQGIESVKPLNVIQYPFRNASHVYRALYPRKERGVRGIRRWEVRNCLQLPFQWEKGLVLP